MALPNVLTDNFAVFRRPQTAEDVPTWKPVVIDERFLGAPLNTHARQVPPNNVRGTLWLVPHTKGVLCLSSLKPEFPGPSAACSRYEDVAKYGLVATQKNGRHDVDVTGVVPDRAGPVTLTSSRGKRTHLPVSDNVFAYNSRRSVQRVSWVIDGHRQIFRLGRARRR